MINVNNKKTNKIFSWFKPSEKSLSKNLDYSSFNNKGSVIPKELYSFFDIPDTKEKIKVYLVNNNKKYTAHITWTRPSSPVRRIFWGSDFADFLKDSFLDWEKIKPQTKNTNFNLSFKIIEKHN